MFDAISFTPFINIFFITVISYLLVSSGYKIFISHLDYYKPAVSTFQRQETKITRTIRPLSAYRAIISRNLFNTPEITQKGPLPEAASKSEKEVADLKPTELKLKLWGTVTGDRKKAYAVIEEVRKRKQSLYKEGDTIQGAIVKRILREKVVLTVNGKDEILAMEKKSSRFSPVSSGKFGPFGPKPRASLSRRGIETDLKKSIALKREEIENAVSNVNTLMKQARIRPHFRNGKPDGLTISRIKSGSLFTRLGLRSGDIITGVNGQPIESVDDALRFYNSLKSSSQVSLQIRRRGKLRDFDYRIE